MPFVSSPESIYNVNNNINNNLKNNINYYITKKKVTENENINKKLNNPTIEIIKNNNIINNSQCYKSNCSNISSNINNNNENYNQEEQYLRNTYCNNPNIKVIHTHTKSFQPISEETKIRKETHIIDKNKTLVNNNNNINFSHSSITYPLQPEKNTTSHYRSEKMKSQTSVLSHLPMNTFNNINENVVSPPYVTPMYYTSSVPLTATTTATTTANMNSGHPSSILSAYFCDDDEQYLVNDNNTITYIVNSNHNEKPISMTPPSKNATLIGTITNSPSSIHNVCYNQPNKINSTNTRSSNSNTQVKSLLPMKYYTNNFINGIYMLNSSPMNASTIPTNTTSTNDTNNTPMVNTKSVSQLKNTKSSFYGDSFVIKNNDDAIAMNLHQITNNVSTSPRINPVRNSTDTTFTNLEQEKVRGPMMYSTTGNNANVMNISPIVTNIITSKSNTSNTIPTLAAISASSAASSTSSSTISILSASSGNSNLVLKDSGLTCSPESTHDESSKKTKQSRSSKHSKKKSTSLCDKSGIIGFAAEILTSVLPTSGNNLKHPKTRYLPELYPFIKKIAHKCKIDIRTFLYALVYSQRFAEALLSHHKEAVGEYGTNHRIFLGSLLLAYQYQIEHGMKVCFKLDAKKLSKYTDGVWTEKEVEMMRKALLSTKNFTLDIDDNVVKQFVETHKADLCWYS